MQSSLKFIVRRGKDYILNLYDPNEIVEWKDVVQVIYNMANAEDVQCPICLETLKQIVSPRITKCGHIYCWPCVLQYLAFEREKSWKKCPLCNDPVYKHQLKPVIVRQTQHLKQGEEVTFHLMVRSKNNIMLKDKFLAG